MASSSRSELVRMAAVLAALLVVTGAVVLLTGSGGDSGSQRASVDGRLTSVSDDQLVLQPAAGGSPQTFSIRSVDRPRLDILHLEQHMAQNLPSRVFYVTDDGLRYAVRVDDLPVGTAPPAP